MIFEDGRAKPLEFQSPLIKYLLFLLRHASRVMVVPKPVWCLLGKCDQTLDMAVQQIAKRSETFCSLLQ